MWERVRSEKIECALGRAGLDRTGGLGIGNGGPVVSKQQREECEVDATQRRGSDGTRMGGGGGGPYSWAVCCFFSRFPGGVGRSEGERRGRGLWKGSRSKCGTVRPRQGKEGGRRGLALVAFAFVNEFSSVSGDDAGGAESGATDSERLQWSRIVQEECTQVVVRSACKRID